MGGNQISKVSESNDDNLETFSLLWLDEQVNKTEENRNTQVRLRQVINHLKTFDDLNACQRHIQSISPQDRIVLITSGRYGRELVHRIHHLRQISSIYIYCLNKEANVRDVLIKLDDLVNRITNDKKNHVNVDESPTINIFKTDKSTTELNGYFVQSLLLMDVLLRIKPTEQDKQELIKVCKKEYKDNQTQLGFVREFEKEYTSDKALYWYSRDAFVYRMLNKALRESNIELLFLFRFVLIDLYQHLEKNQCQRFVRVYRGQQISPDELKTLHQSINQLISVNSFFSTSLNSKVALNFANNDNNSDDLQNVVFEIEADPGVVRSKPFAEISSTSYYIKEREVLFMNGCIFRITGFRPQNNQQPCTIRMQLCNDNEHHLKELYDHMKEEHCGGNMELDLMYLADLLNHMGKYDLAEDMCYRSLKKMSTSNPLRFKIYWSLGVVAKHKGAYDLSIQWLRKSLEYRLKDDPYDYISIANLYNLIGDAYRRQDERGKALNYYESAVELYQKHRVNDKQSLSYFYNNIGLLYDTEKRYPEALDFYQKSLDIKEDILPSDHSMIATSYNNIACVYYRLRRYELAIEYYKRALQIYLKTFSAQHPDIGMCHRNIGLVHEATKRWKEALECYEKADAIYDYSLPPDHSDRVQLSKNIQSIRSKCK